MEPNDVHQRPWLEVILAIFITYGAIITFAPPPVGVGRSPWGGPTVPSGEPVQPRCSSYSDGVFITSGCRAPIRSH